MGHGFGPNKKRGFFGPKMGVKPGKMSSLRVKILDVST
ncbi:hypothetical protein CWATWH0402_3869 [Crocosphaera watsonii WH 0402]|uniref:Uncharacterized protein n=1 Tax=Crocosphaera watsonii WH 0402 TaxID=1284629 RepID=T2JLF9_CROWT|nr:hypothetical protein CWATWH0402_3869 [Crocosphaera watsonii WH 0402]